MTMRLITAGQDRASAAIANQSAIDGLTGSGYTGDGSDFAGFGKKDPSLMRFAGGPFYDATHPTYGAKADGVHDDRAALFAANAAVGAAGVMQLLPGVYLVGSNLTIDCTTLRVIAGAKLRPALGVTITINCTHLDIGPYAVFDNSLGGAFVFGAAARFEALWFVGVWGNGISDDTAGMTFLTDSVPDNASVYFGRLKLIISGEWLTEARAGLKYISDIPVFPEGLAGASITWKGPPPTYGPDAHVSVNSPIVTFDTPMVPMPHVGDRFIISTPGNYTQLNSTVKSVDSATQVTLWDSALTNAGPMAYTIGGVMINFSSANNCELIGFGIFPHPRVSDGGKGGQGFAGYITAGSKTLTNKGNGEYSLFLNQQGHMIRVVGAGPGGKDLITTIASVPSDGLTCTLTDAASTTISSTQLTEYVVGATATTLPAIYAIVCDKTAVNGVTGTNCYFVANLFLSQINYAWTVLGISLTAPSNQECHRFLRNTVHSADFSIESVLPACSTLLNSNVVTLNGVGLNARPNWIGRRVRIPGAGAINFTDGLVNGTQLQSASGPFRPEQIGQTIVLKGAGVAGADFTSTLATFNGTQQIQMASPAPTPGVYTGYVTGGLLDTKIIGIQDDSHFLTRDNALVAVSAKTPVIGECRSIGVNIGPSLNAKKESIRDNIWSGMKWCVWCQGGGFDAYSNQMEVCEVGYRLDGNDVPCASRHDDHEGLLRFADVETGGQPFTIAETRMGSINMTPQGGHIRLGAGARIVRVIGAGFDTPTTQAEHTFFEVTGGSGQLEVEGCLFPDGTTFANCISIATAIAFSNKVQFRGNQRISDAPADDVFVTANTGATAAAGLNIRSSSADKEMRAIDVVHYNNGGTSGLQAGLRARFENIQGLAFGEQAAIDAGVGQEYGGANLDGTNAAAVLVRMPTAASWRNTIGGFEIKGVHVLSPANVGNASNPLYGMLIEPIGVAGVSKPRGIWQKGASDLNLIAGRLLQAAPAAAPTDADLLNNTVSLYLDESGNNLKVRVRKSDGTYKTATVALV